MKSAKAINSGRMNKPDEKIKASYMVPAVDRAIRILSLLKNEKREMTIAEISEATGWNKSSIYKLLLTLDHHGLLSRDLATKKYSLGIALMDYGRAVLNGFEIRHAAKPSLRELARYTGESVAVSILSGTQMTLVEVEESAAQVRIALNIGMSTPATATSHGKAVLAYLPEGRLEDILRIEGLPRYTKKSIVNDERYRKALDTVRKQGYAADCEEFEEGLAGISAPVFSADGVIGALLIAMPSFKLTKEKIHLFGMKCAEEAARVSALLQ
jgi:DNA-binding IclR family transcriptional regulator